MTSFRTATIAVAVAVAMAGSAVSGSGALAADARLAPGKPAGVHEAARSPRLWVIGGAAALAVVGIAIAVAQSNNTQCGSACTPPSTTSTTS